MCIVSNVTDFYQKQWGNPWQPPTQYTIPGVIITKEQFEEYLRLKKMAEELDSKTKQPNCIKPEMLEWEKQIEVFLRKKGIL